MPRKAKHVKDVASLARIHTETMVSVLHGIATSPEAPHASRVAAANGLLDRGWGKPKANLTIEDKTQESAVSEQLESLFGIKTIEGKAEEISPIEATHNAPEREQ